MFGNSFANVGGGGGVYGSPTPRGNRPGGFLGATNSPSAGGDSQNRINCIYPASVAQLLQIQEVDGKMLHHDREISQVRVIGMIHDVRVEGSRHIYTLSDMTGDIEVQQFLDSDNSNEMQQMEIIRDGNWGVVLGTLKNFQNKRSITGFRLVQLRDANEITTHILECIDANVYFRKLAKESKMGGTGGIDTMSMQVDSRMGNSQQNSFAMGSGLSPLQQQLVMSISACHDERGLSIHDMISTLSAQYKDRDIRQAVDFLVQEGHIYSSVDDEHFLTTS